MVLQVCCVPATGGHTDTPTCLVCGPSSPRPSSAVESFLGIAIPWPWSRSTAHPPASLLSADSHLESEFQGGRVQVTRAPGTRNEAPPDPQPVPAPGYLPAHCPQHPLLPAQALPPLGPRRVRWEHPPPVLQSLSRSLGLASHGGGPPDPSRQPWGAQKSLPSKVQGRSWGSAQRGLNPAQGHTELRTGSFLLILRNECEQNQSHLTHTHTVTHTDTVTHPHKTQGLWSAGGPRARPAGPASTSLTPLSLLLAHLPSQPPFSFTPKHTTKSRHLLIAAGEWNHERPSKSQPDDEATKLWP